MMGTPLERSESLTRCPLGPLRAVKRVSRGIYGAGKAILKAIVLTIT